MNPFVFACITPHGGEIIPELRGNFPSRMEKTRSSMEEIGKRMTDANPDCIIVLTPHGTKINGQFSIVDSERLYGVLEENGAVYKLERFTERDLAKALVHEAKIDDISASSINYGTSEGTFSCLPLDWGAIVPLSFMPNVPVVVITPSRDIPFEQHLRFGASIRKAVEKYGKRVGIIASCDWSHTHNEDGPYGYHPSAKQLDAEAVSLIKSNELEKMMNWDQNYINQAKPDGIWQTLILAGAIPVKDRQVEFHSYEAPTYFGLICASFK